MKYFELCWNQLCTCWRIGATKWHDLTIFFFVFFSRTICLIFSNLFKQPENKRLNTHMCVYCLNWCSTQSFESHFLQVHEFHHGLWFSKIVPNSTTKLSYILILLHNLTWLKCWKSWGELKYYNILKNLTHILHLHIIIKLLHFFQFSNTLVLYVVSVGINKITFEI